MPEIRCLSVRQPFAWALAANIKSIENRVWTTDYRGTIALHASASLKDLNAFRKSSQCDQFSTQQMAVGAIIGWIDILDVQPYGPALEDNPFAFGPYCWTVGNGRFLEQPIPMKGKLNLFKLGPKIQEQLAGAKTYQVNVELDFAEVAAHLTPTVDPEPAYSSLLEHLAGTGKHDEAISSAYEWLISNAPENPIGFAIRAALNSESRPETDTINDFRSALNIVPSYSFALMELGYFLLDRERLAEMEPLIERALSDDVDCASAYVIRSEIALQRGDANAALFDGEKAIALEPHTASGYLQVAKAHLALGNEPRAKTVLEEGLVAVPGHEWLLELLGEIS